MNCECNSNNSTLWLSHRPFNLSHFSAQDLFNLWFNPSQTKWQIVFNYPPFTPNRSCNHRGHFACLLDDGRGACGRASHFELFPAIHKPQDRLFSPSHPRRPTPNLSFRFSFTDCDCGAFEVPNDSRPKQFPPRLLQFANTHRVRCPTPLAGRPSIGGGGGLFGRVCSFGCCRRAALDITVSMTIHLWHIVARTPFRLL